MTVIARVVVLPQQAGAPLRVEEIDLPAPRAHEVVLKQFASGICQTQLEYMARPRDTAQLLGHESTGEVLAVGDAVTSVNPGDRVLVTWMPNHAVSGGRQPDPSPLRTRSGEPLGVRVVFTWADHIVTDEQHVMKLPDGVDPVPAAVIGCAVITGAGTVRVTSDVQPGDSVVVIGTGGVGLCAVSAASILGASPLIAIDLSTTNRALAKEFGATHVFDPAGIDIVETIRKLTRQPGKPGIRGEDIAGADHVLDFVGTPRTLDNALAATRPCCLGLGAGGQMVIAGVPTPEWTISPRDLLYGEKRIATSVGGGCVPARDLPQYLGWYADGRLPLDRLVTRRYRIEDINEATDALASGQITGRAVIVFD